MPAGPNAQTNKNQLGYSYLFGQTNFSSSRAKGTGPLINRPTINVLNYFAHMVVTPIFRATFGLPGTSILRQPGVEGLRQFPGQTPFM